MATNTATLSRDQLVASSDCWIATWTAMGDADTGTAIRMGGASDRSIQFSGTFGGATIVLQGTNDGTNWVTLTDPQGNAISKTSASIEQICELTRQVRVVSSGGTGTSIDANLYLRGMTL